MGKLNNNNINNNNNVAVRFNKRPITFCTSNAWEPTSHPYWPLRAAWWQNNIYIYNIYIYIYVSVCINRTFLPRHLTSYLHPMQYESPPGTMLKHLSNLPRRRSPITIGVYGRKIVCLFVCVFVRCLSRPRPWSDVRDRAIEAGKPSRFLGGRVIHQ